jgi:hypothetical protein
MAAATRTDNIWSPVGADFDNDGRLDVFAPSGAYAASLDQLYEMAKRLALTATVEQSDCLIRNVGGGVFQVQRVPNPSTTMSLFPKWSAVADYNGDGKVDIAVLEAFPDSSLRLLRNDTPPAGNHWIAFRLIGKSGDRDQLGATVTLFDGTAEFARSINSGGIGISSEVLHFGVGARLRVDSARVRWADATTTTLPGPFDVDRVIDVHQP